MNGINLMKGLNDQKRRSGCESNLWNRSDPPYGLGTRYERRGCAVSTCEVARL